MFFLYSQQKVQKAQVWGGSTTVKKQVAGTASSVAFTPLQVDKYFHFLTTVQYFLVELSS